MPDVEQQAISAVQDRTLMTIERALSILRHPSGSNVSRLSLEDTLAQLQWCEDRTFQIEQWTETITARRNQLMQHLTEVTNVESLHERRSQRAASRPQQSRPGRGRRASRQDGG